MRFPGFACHRAASEISDLHGLLPPSARSAASRSMVFDRASGEMSRTIYVQLLEEGIDVWRPVEAEEEDDGAFRLPAHAPSGEVWEFEPGSLVACEDRLGDLVAVRLVQR